MRSYFDTDFSMLIKMSFITFFSEIRYVWNFSMFPCGIVGF